jgi:hypothetical protein
MGIPKYLESKIKSIFHCCIEPLVAQFQAVINPSSPNFLLTRPNEEPFVLGGPNADQAIVGMADYAANAIPILTGRQYSGKDVYEVRHEVTLTTTGGTVALPIPSGYTGVDRLLEVDLIFSETATSSQIYLNGGGSASICDAYIGVVTGGVMNLYWGTTHTNDKVFALVRFVPISVP